MKKILSLALAATMAISCCVMNTFAATEHTVTLSANKTTELAAGDKIEISIKADNLANLVSLTYDIEFDTDVFAADTAGTWMSNKDWSSQPNFISQDWYDNTFSSSPFKSLLNPTISVKNGNLLHCGGAGANGIPAAAPTTNLEIGRFTLTVKDGVADGSYTFTVTGECADAGDNSATPLVGVPVTVKVGEDAPATPTPTVTPDPTEDPATPTPEVNYIAPDNAVADTGAVWTAETYTDIDTDANNYEIVFAANDDAKATFALDFGNIVTSGSATFDIVLRTAKTIVGYVINAIAK